MSDFIRLLILVCVSDFPVISSPDDGLGVSDPGSLTWFLQSPVLTQIHQFSREMCVFVTATGQELGDGRHIYISREGPVGTSALCGSLRKCALIS